MSKSRWIWLSHITDLSTPVYGGGEGFEVSPDKTQSCGDSCNTVTLKLPNHIGSHVDAPKHFIEGGMCVDSYSADDWVFTKPLLLNVIVEQSGIIDSSHVAKVQAEVNHPDADLILFRTGAEQYRGDEAFWKMPPGFSPELCGYLKNRFPSFKAIGMDTISISSFAHRDVGREAHKEFLSSGIRIFEDLSLAFIEDASCLTKVIALPFRYAKSDGAPTSLIGEVTE